MLNEILHLKNIYNVFKYIINLMKLPSRENILEIFVFVSIFCISFCKVYEQHLFGLKTKDTPTPKQIVVDRKST